ncbi:hypothetical protein ITP53_40380 [Nonomuraea sp. K274]|uniref:DUF6968 domain-containing protein n=1 Tax=Nonomuraea cypriaca TaxID=1187855 RepID=A0A931AHN7_9ACTN|nr:hypothetical protein [Nonomuraea cypriaca]MBF8191835.1 hypothetical protein [Nonomuraea cypriaca]
MTTYELGEVVAERKLEAVAADGSRTPVTVRFGKPYPDPLSTHGDWCCPHQILGLGEEGAGGSFGVDSLQALLLSVFKVRLKLGERARAGSVRLDWLGQDDLGLEADPEPRGVTAPRSRS